MSAAPAGRTRVFINSSRKDAAYVQSRDRVWFLGPRHAGGVQNVESILED